MTDTPDMPDRLSPLASASATREVLERHGLATKKALGQNFLVNDGILKRICALSEVGPDDDVLEVGPGIGTLTLALLQFAGSVTSVERDEDLPAVLAETCSGFDTFTLISKDALDLKLGDVSKPPTKLIANLPYAVAATIVLDYFERFESLQSATVMVQQEVADRMAAVPGTKNYGAYTVKLNLFARPAGRFTVGPQNFFPPPRVTSTVLRLDRTTDDSMSPMERSAAMVMADAAFASRRKTISNSCKTFFASAGDARSMRGVNIQGAADVLPDLFHAAGIDPKRRGESLCLDEFKALGAALIQACS